MLVVGRVHIINNEFITKYELRAIKDQEYGIDIKTKMKIIKGL